MGRKKLYKEPTKVVSKKVPISRIPDFITRADGILKTYSEEDSKLINELQAKSLTASADSAQGKK